MSGERENEGGRPVREALGLRYDPDADGAPELVARGRGEVAQRILAIAAECGVPVREDPDLVQLLSFTEVGEEIPVEVQGTRETHTGTLREAKKRAALEVEARVIKDALAKARGNVSAVARQMGITPRAVHMKLRAHSIDAATYRARTRE